MPRAGASLTTQQIGPRGYCPEPDVRLTLHRAPACSWAAEPTRGRQEIPLPRGTGPQLAAPMQGALHDGQARSAWCPAPWPMQPRREGEARRILLKSELEGTSV